MVYTNTVRLHNTIEVASITVTTDASGDFSGTVAVNGQIKKVALVIGTLTAGAVDTTLTDNVTLETIHAVTDAAASFAAYPIIQNVDAANSGVAGEYTESVIGTAKLVVADGGNVTTGTFYIYYTRL